ncbi:MAG: ribosome silencing factor [Actinomycetota bacterium]
MSDSRELVVAAARAAASKQARDVVVLDVRQLIVITDYFLIASGTSDRQVRTIAEEIESSVRAKGLRPVRREGEREGHWALLDFVDFVAHVFLDSDREFYDLERLWSDAPTVEWEEATVSTGG